MKGEAYDPSSDLPPELLENGSDCSTAGINLLILRNQRLSEARHYAENRWDPKKPFNQSPFQVPKAA